MKKINNVKLKQTILTALGKNQLEDFDEADLGKIENILLTERTIGGTPTGITFSDIFYFPQLKYLSLQYFEVNDKLIKVLEEHLPLSEISFIDCNFDYENFQSMKNVPISLKFIKCQNIPKILPPTKKMYFDRCTVDFDSLDFTSLEYLKISFSNVKNAHDIDDENASISTIEILQSTLCDKNQKEIETIKVPKNTLFTKEEKDTRYVDNR